MNNKIILSLIVGVIISLSWISGNAQVKREYRGVWVSAYVSDWPSSAITAGNAATHKKACDKMLDSLAVNNFTTVFYHVRAMCDAMYDSAYEPWSSYVSATRGVAPAFDPFAYILEEGHKRGLEVYAWVNPYRYSPSTTQWGGSDRDYINTHPEWLISNSKETVLNPGIPEVKQRIIDVIADIISKYNLDGIVFDDYFYNGGGIGFEVDVDLYNAYTAKGGNLSHADWRRENINSMVRDVNSMIKAIKPSIRFGISPAGIAGTAMTSATKYGVKPSPGSDWQYNQIYSDPLGWMSDRSIDFVSPQVYWPVNGANDFDAVTEWWSYIAKHFNRHFYVSQTVDKTKFYAFQEYQDEVHLIRNHNEDGAPGTVYFKYATLADAYEKFDGKFVRLPHYLKRTVYAHKSLAPALSWMKPDELGVPAMVAYSNGMLSCTPNDKARYVVYAVPNSVSDADFHKESEYMLGVSYVPTFVIPADKRIGYRYAMAYLDGYGNEYSAVFAGAQLKNLATPTITFPANGATAPDLFEFAWSGDGQEYMVEIYEDAQLTKVVTAITTDMTMLSSSQITLLETGKTYYWRVISRASNSNDGYSDVYSFIPTVLSITSPVAESSNISLTPKIEWSAAKEGSKYLLEIAKELSMNNIVISEEVATTEFNVPQFRLSGNTKYFIRVTAKHGENIKSSQVIGVTTVDHVPNMPVVITPTDGATMFNNSCVQLKAEAGIRRARIEIASSTSFPSRASYVTNLENFVFSSDEMNKVKISGAGLVNGNTYYLRARFEYLLSTSTSAGYTEYTTPISFVYSSESGIGDVSTSEIKIEGNVLIIPLATGAETVEVYSPSGVLVSGTLGNGLIEGYNEILLDGLGSGVYLIRVKGVKAEKTLKYVK